MPNMKSPSLTVQNLWPRLKLFCHRVTDRQTGQKLDAPEFASGGIKIAIKVQNMLLLLEQINDKITETCLSNAKYSKCMMYYNVVA